MTDAAEPSVEHASFTIEREYDFSPAQVWAAWATPQAKRRWFAEGEGFSEISHELDFRVGGAETASGRHEFGFRFTNDTVYHDVVEERRIIFAYRMTIDGKPISVSLTTVTIEPKGEGARLVYTEYGAFLDGLDGMSGVKSRETGCAWLLERLDAEMRSHAK